MKRWGRMNPLLPTGYVGGCVGEVMESLNSTRPRILRTEMVRVGGRWVPLHYCESLPDALRRYDREGADEKIAESLRRVG